MTDNQIKLTEFSHGAGCGCKISPSILDQILKQSHHPKADYPNLLVGNDSKDDAAVLNIGEGRGLISTTDFFMPIVDDPFDFGRIASVNAISDVYAMGGKPVLAIAILGWPINKLSPLTASKVMEGAKDICIEAGIPLAGGHSIDCPEPIFGLSVNGIINIPNIKRNNSARAESLLYLTKPLGTGILSTALKKGILAQEDLKVMVKSMTTLNKIGYKAGALPFINAMTDITGFGLLGHLLEICEGSDLQAEIYFSKVPQFENLNHYLNLNSIPGGTLRNWESYGDKIGELSEMQKFVLADPQTSGGLLMAVDYKSRHDFETFLNSEGFSNLAPIGKLYFKNKAPQIVVSP